MKCETQFANIVMKNMTSSQKFSSTEDKRGASTPVFSQLELQKKRRQVLRRKDEIRNQFYESIAIKVLEGML